MKKNFLWKLFQLPEMYAACLSLGCFFSLGAHYLYWYHESPTKANHVWAIICYHLSGGAAFGVMKGAGYSDFSMSENILVNTLLTAGIILIFNALFSLSCNKLLHIGFLENSFGSLRDNANNQKKTWVKYGVPGIFAFVFFPMTGTGPVIGSVIAKFIGLGFWTSILTATAGSFASILVFGCAADLIGNLVGDRVLSGVMLALIILVLLGALYARIRARKSAVIDQSTPAVTAASSPLREIKYVMTSETSFKRTQECCAETERVQAAADDKKNV